MSSSNTDEERELLDGQRLLRSARPPVLDEQVARRFARAAIEQARARERSRVRWRISATTAAIAALTLLAVLQRPHPAQAPKVPRDAAVVSSVPGSSAAPLPRRVLASGDAITATPDAQMVVVMDAPSQREIRLSEGEALFEVMPLPPDANFIVTTPHLMLRVRGTVFSVAVDAVRTIVRVYAGRVLIAPGSELELEAQQSFDSSSRTSVGLDTGRFMELADLAVHAEARRSAAVPSPQRPDDPDAGSRRLQRTGAAPTAGAVRLWVAQGQLSRALEAVERGVAAKRDLGTWLMLRGDVLKGLRRHEEAAATYEALIVHGRGPERVQAGYLAARLRLLDLQDAQRALADLDVSGAAAQGSILEERALVLRVDALRRLGHDAEVREVARHYLERFPSAGRAAEMRGLAVGRTR